MKRSKVVYFPSGVSSIFKICYEGNRDLIYEGAKGGGFKIKLGSYTYSKLSEKDEVIINGKKLNAKTTFKVIELMKKIYGIKEGIKVIHEIKAPIGYGFGTSGSGALGAVFSISDLFNIKEDFNKLAQIAHKAEILASTGLGTVSGLAHFKGNVGVIIKPGAPGICEIKELEIEENVLFISIIISPISKDSIIFSEKYKNKINSLAEELIQKILEERNAEGLLKYSRIFCEKAGFADKYLIDLMDKLIKLGFIGVTQNMIGRAVHGIINKNKFEKVKKEIYKIAGNLKVFVSDI